MREQRRKKRTLRKRSVRQVKKDSEGVEQWETRDKKQRKRTVQIFVKVDGVKTSAMGMDMSDKWEMTS